jgi:ribosomal protein L11 methyltransferase
VLAELLELAPSGVEETDRGDGTIEYAVYGAPGELPELPDLRAAAAGALVDISTEELAEDWEQRWRQFHRPLVIEGRLTVRPPWEPEGDEPLDVVIDPGHAFGTGAHATTRLCLELLLELDAPEGPFIDLGSGSGVLAITAAKLGFSPVLALDIERAAVKATRENAERNGVELEVRRFDLRTEQVPPAETVAANLLAALLLQWAGGAERLPDRVIAGGLLEHEGERVAKAFAARGLKESARRAGGEWLALLLANRRAPPPR